MNFTIYIKHAFKNIKADIKISTIVTFGFFVSLLSTFIIYTFVTNEYSYNSKYDDSELLYRLEQKDNVMFSGAIGDCLKQKIPQIENVVKLNPWNSPSVSKINTQGNTTIFGDIYRTGSSWNDLFSLNIIEGDISKVFNEKNKIALNETTVKKIFGHSEVVGEKINLNHKFSKSEELSIAAVYQDITKNNSMRPIGIYSLREDRDLHSREFKSYSIYIKLSQINDINDLTDKINEILINEGLIENINPILLCEIKDIHFSSEIENDYIEKGDKTKNYYFSLIAVVIYFISLVNYFNFRIVIVEKRKVKLLINRVAGASNVDLLIINYIENLILLTISSILSVLVVIVLKFIWPSQVIIGNRIDLLIYFVVFALFTVILITSLPYITSLIKRKSINHNKPVNSLVSIVQFTIIFILLVCTIFIYRHKEYLLSYSVGINSNNVITLQLNTDILKHYNELTSEFKSHSQIMDVTYASNEPNNVEYKISNKNGKETKFGIWIVDNNFMSFFNIKSLEGEEFNGKTSSRNYSTIVNQKAFEKYNLELHQPIPSLWSKCKLSGVCENFNYESLHSDIEPLCLIYQRNYCNVAYIKYTGQPSSVLEYLQKSVNKFNPELPFQYHFLKDTFLNYYKDEIYLLNLLSLFCVVAIFITIIGLLGLTNVLIQKRVKEIGIRKANGANVVDIMFTINKNLFLRLFLAFIIGTPIAYFILDIWLENFACKTPLTGWYFIFSGLVIVLLTSIVIYPVCITASKANPSKILRQI